MSKQKRDLRVEVPKTGLGLKEIPASPETFEAAHEVAMFKRDSDTTWRAEIAYIFLKAKREGLPAVLHLWRRPKPPKKAGAPDLYFDNDMAQRGWLIEQMADGLPYHTACRKAEDEGRIDGGVTKPGSWGRRLARRFDRKTMEAAAREFQKRRPSM